MIAILAVQMLTCPVCAEEFNASGLHPHLRSHEASELASVVAKVAKNSDEATTSGDTPTPEPACHPKTRKMAITRQRNERNRKIKQHLRQLDQQINTTLKNRTSPREKS